MHCAVTEHQPHCRIALHDEHVVSARQSTLLTTRVAFAAPSRCSVRMPMPFSTAELLPTARSSSALMTPLAVGAPAKNTSTENCTSVCSRRALGAVALSTGGAHSTSREGG
jgi:hypothetical protein